jgi:hypothetical protein
VLKKLLRRAVRRAGFDIVRYQAAESYPPDLDEDDEIILRRIRGCSMTSLERQAALVQAVRYLSRRRVEGCIVECGVWRGGSSMAAALTLIQEADANRHLYLLDTFEGMTPPTAVDATTDGTSAQTHLDRDADETGYRCVAGIDEVRQNMTSTGYRDDLIHYVKGPVETTLPDQAPVAPIALLRLDTDWYESTWHELVHLFPKVAEGGVLILDDYGHWAGARKAIDEYLSGLPRQFFMHRIDYTGRLLIKL